jgi:predicted ATP-grasp superfamily ATP-dependent carboligase
MKISLECNNELRSFPTSYRCVKTMDKEIAYSKDGRNFCLVVAFNARPIATSAKKANYNVLAVDFFGDLDLRSVAEHVFSVLWQRKGHFIHRKFYRPISEYMYLLAETMAEEYFEKIKFLLIGSGFDDEPKIWEQLNQIAPILGNTPELIARADRLNLYKIASKLGISYPQTIEAKDDVDATEIAKNIGYPFVLTTPRSAGGLFVKLITNKDELHRAYNELQDSGKKILIQEFIQGIDASCSVLGTGKDCQAIAVTEQLIGKSELGVSMSFGYCGNIVPLRNSATTIENIKRVSEELGSKLGLLGSNGFDFVIRNGQTYLIELNPRFQGTLECIEAVTSSNLVNLHIQACKGYLPEKPLESKGYAVKMILYAKQRIIVPNLSHMHHIVDVPVEGIILEPSNPVCTVFVTGRDRKTTIKKAKTIANNVYRQLIPAP